MAPPFVTMRGLAPRSLFLPGVGVALLLAGCASSPEDRALHAVYDAHRNAIVARYGTPATPTAASLQTDDEPVTGTERNARINDFIFLIDRNYDHWEKVGYDRKAYGDFLSSATIIGLNGIGAVTGGTALKAVLATASGALEGASAAFNKDVLQNQTTIAIISKMRALRATRLAEIRGKMVTPAGVPTSPGKYPMSEAYIDLAAYYNAGTFVGALQDIVDQAGKEKTKAQDKIENSTRKSGTAGAAQKERENRVRAAELD